MTESLKYATVDKTESPLIRVTFTGNKDTEQTFEAYLEELDECYASRKKISILFDARKAIIPQMKHQKQQGLWLQKNWFTIQSYCQGTAYVISNPAIRAVLKMIFSFQNQPAPYKLFSNVEKAADWLRAIETKKDAA